MNPLDPLSLQSITRRRFFSGAVNTIGAALGTAALADGLPTSLLTTSCPAQAEMLSWAATTGMPRL